MSVFVIRTLSLEWSGYRESAGERELEREIGQTPPPSSYPSPLASLQDARGITRRRSGPGSAPELIRSLLSTAALATTQTQTTQIAYPHLMRSVRHRLKKAARWDEKVGRALKRTWRLRS